MRSPFTFRPIGGFRPQRGLSRVSGARLYRIDVFGHHSIKMSVRTSSERIFDERYEEIAVS
ncbi:1-deoxy-D-xylulose-5-phosphate synthase [Schaalia cardiffensis F0333]|uniref:1-deoxy-D-xylulose-5-phosphate synthase n=1 Tax=Schaalia cardiffensis F0333 TaxID=888050 RepID=N6XBB3_9ACTO|nr:1-deoxy-D-xylulose-5-phosphate synthase [Schaalia cardiffensis F0333]